MALIANLAPRNIVHSTGSDGELGYQLDVIAPIEEEGIAVWVLPGPLDEGIEASDVVMFTLPPGGYVASGQMGAPVGVGTYTETMFVDAGSGMATGLAPGLYTIYACADGIDLMTYTLEIEDISGPGVRDVEVVDAQQIVSNSSASGTASLLSASDLSGDDEGDDVAIVVICAESNGYEIPGPVTYGGEALTQIHAGSGGTPTIWARLGVSQIGSRTLSITGDPFDGEDLGAVAYSLRGVKSLRQINVAAVAGDLGLSLAARGGAAMTPPGEPWIVDAQGYAGSARHRVGIAHQQLDSDGVPSVSWGTGAQTAFLALEPFEADVIPEDPPESIPTFDVAAGSDRIALRSVVYSGEDNDTTNFRLQYQVGEGAIVDYAGPYTGADAELAQFGVHAVIDDLTPGGTYQVRMRAINDSGDGDWSDWHRVRTHFAWHQHGIKRFNPSPAVGHATESYDLGAGTTGNPGISMTAGGRSDRAVLVGDDIGYVQGAAENIRKSVWRERYYDDVQMDLAGVWYEEATAEVVRNNHGGGALVHVLAGVPAGTHTLTWQNDAAGIERSTWSAGCALYNVHQGAPLGGIHAGLWAHDASTTGPPLVPLNGNSGMAYRFAAGAPCSLDEALVVFTGFYSRGIGPFTSESQEVITTALGEGYGNAPPRVIATGDMDGMITAPSGSELIAGSGAGLEDGSKLWWFPQSVEPGTVIDGDYFRFWATIAPIAIRPSPNMLHTLSVPGATEEAVTWTCESDCNHGRVLVALTPMADAAPTAEQIRDAIDDTSDYGGTFVALDTYDLEGEGAFGDSLEAELEPEAKYRLSVVYESWQWNLGDPLEVEEVELQRPIELEGAASAEASAAGALTTEIPLAGAALSVSAAGVSMTTEIPLAGGSAAQPVAGGVLDTSVVLAGVARVSVTAGGNLTALVRLEGAALAAALASGSMTTAIRLSGAAGAVARATGAIGSGAALAGDAGAQAGAAGDLSTEIPLSGAAAAAADAGAELTIEIRLAGAAVAAALAEGDLTAPGAGLAGSAQASAAAGGSISTAIPLAGAALVATSATGNIAQLIELSGAAAAVVTGQGSLNTAIRLRGDSISAALAAGELTARIEFDGAALARASAGGHLSSGPFEPAPERILRLDPEYRHLAVPAQSRTLRIMA